MSDKPAFFAELKRRNVIPIEDANDSISRSDLRTGELHRTIFTSVSPRTDQFNRPGRELRRAKSKSMISHNSIRAPSIR
jgi:hypothetical protein